MTLYETRIPTSKNTTGRYRSNSVSGTKFKVLNEIKSHHGEREWGKMWIHLRFLDEEVGPLAMRFPHIFK